MNIFYLDESPTLAARFHCDRHNVKMILESCQILSTVHRVLDGTQVVSYETGRKKTTWKLIDPTFDFKLYKATHVNHPCTVWARASTANYIWLLNMTEALCEEYTYRYGKIHKSSGLLPYLKHLPKNILMESMTKPALAMPVEYHRDNPVEAYRQYYIREKARICTWKKREKPPWFTV